MCIFLAFEHLIIFKSEISCRRNSTLRTSIIIFDWNSKHLQSFDPRNKSLTQMHPFNEEMKEQSFSAVSIGHFIYIVTYRLLYRLKCSEENSIWEHMPNLPDDFGVRPQACSNSNAIYVAGCKGSRKFTRSALKYHHSTNRWEKLDDKLLNTYYSAVVATEEYIYSVAGEAKNTGATNRVERLNTSSQTWEEVAPMRQSRYGACGDECRGQTQKRRSFLVWSKCLGKICFE